MNTVLFRIYFAILRETCLVIGSAAEAARGGADKLKPTLQKIYYSRAQIFRDTAMGFIEGYKEGLREVISPEPTSQQPPSSHDADHATPTTAPQDNNITGDNAQKDSTLGPVSSTHTSPSVPSPAQPAEAPQASAIQDQSQKSNQSS